MEPDAQHGLLSCIVQLIDERYGGQIAKRYMNELAVAYVSWPSVELSPRSEAALDAFRIIFDT
jgi:hypothetical protein